VCCKFHRLEGKVVVITGGASGIGEAIAKLFSKHGAKVIIADIQDELGHSICKDLSPQSTSFVHCDVTKETDVENAVNLVVSKLGKLDIMVNNADVAGLAKTDILDITRSKFEQVTVVEIDNKLTTNFPTALYAKYKFGMKTHENTHITYVHKELTWFGQYCLHPPTREFHYEQILTTHSTCPYHPITLCSREKPHTLLSTNNN
jgi:short-subunit dehydrogenase involved in D-alanine esterification of teichoic acids